jgi:hypothetical protein
MVRWRWVWFGRRTSASARAPSPAGGTSPCARAHHRLISGTWTRKSVASKKTSQRLGIDTAFKPLDYGEVRLYLVPRMAQGTTKSDELVEAERQSIARHGRLSVVVVLIGLSVPIVLDGIKPPQRLVPTDAASGRHSSGH